MAEDTDTADDIYVNAGSGVELASSGPSGDSNDSVECEADECTNEAHAFFEAIAADGTVVFSTREQLVPEDQDHAFDIYTYFNGETALTTAGQSGVDTRECSGGPLACAAIFSAVSDNGRVYFTTAEPLVPQDGDLEADLYERAGGQTRLISLGAAAGLRAHPSPDGSTVVYKTETNLVALSGSQRRIVIRDVGSDDEVVDFSADGERILIQSRRPLTDDDDDGNLRDVFRYEDGALALLTGGEDPTGLSNGVAFKDASDDASVIIFETPERLTSDDLDDQIDVYRTDGIATTLVSRGPVGGNAHHCGQDDFAQDSFKFCRAEAEAISSDGSRVIFQTPEALVVEDRAPQDLIFGSDIYEWTAQGTRLVTPGRADGGGRGGRVEFLFASDDARDVFFSTNEPLVERDNDCVGTGDAADIYRQRGSETTLVSELIPDSPTSFRFRSGSSDGHRALFTATVRFEGDEALREPIFEWHDGEFRIVDSDLDREVAKPEESARLNAAYSLRPFYPKVGEPTTFDSELSCDSNGTIVSRRWDLDGDGSFDDGTGKKPTFTYQAPGEYFTALKVVDDDGHVEIGYLEVNAKTNTPPYADVDGGTHFRRPGSEVTFDAEPSFDPDGSVESIAWDLDDDGAFDDASGRHAQARFDSIRDHKVSIRVTDDDGASTVATQTVRVLFENQLPEIFDIEQEVVESSRVRLRAITGDPDGRVVSHDWDLDGDGVFDDATGPIVLHKFPPGHREVRVKVTDDSGGVKVGSIGVTAPSGFTTSWTDDTVSPLEDDPVHFVASSYGQEGQVTYSWDFDNNGTFDATGKEVDWAFKPGNHTIRLRAEAGGQTATILGSKWVDTHAPVARVTITPRRPRPGQSVTLNSSQSYDVDGQIVSRDWGSFGSGTSVTTSFPEPGAYRVPLTLTDEDGSEFEGVTTVYQTVVVGTRPNPQIAITSGNPQINRPVTFSSTASNDPDGNIVSRSWDLDGDGAFGDATGPTAEMSFSEPGEHRVGLLLEDNDGLKARSHRYVYVVESNTPPPRTLIEQGPASRTRDRSATFRFSSADQVVKFECKLDLGPWKKCRSPYEIEATTDGRREFQVRSVKPDGTVDSTPARYVWFIDSVAPEVEVILGERVAQALPSEVSCLATERSGPCTGFIEVLLRGGGQPKLASGRFRTDPGDKARADLRLTRQGKRTIGKQPLRVVVVTRSRDSLGNAKSQRRRDEL